MDRSSRFRSLLARRLLQIAGVAALAPLTQMACSDDSEDDGTNPSTSSSSTSGTSSSTGSGSTSSSTGTGASGGDGGSSVGGGGSGGTAGDGGRAQGGAGGDGTGGSGGTGGVALPCPPKPDCFAWPNSNQCPAQAEALQYFVDDCADGCMPLAVQSEGMLAGGQCCYETTQTECAIIGRPFLVGDTLLHAEARGGSRAWTEREAAPDAADLDPALREALAEAWLTDALLEHASVAAFSRFSLELLAVGAPAELVAAAHEAALDEVRHARRCFALAGAYRGEALEPAAFPFGGAVEVSADIADVAVRTAREGCVGETLAAALAAEQGARASDPAVRAVLAGIAADEARHAELAWRTVAWAIRTGGERVREAVAAVFAQAARELALPLPADVQNAELEAHGRLSNGAAAAVKLRALREIVLPCAAALAPHPIPSAHVHA